jgi:hypothetical protein
LVACGGATNGVADAGPTDDGGDDPGPPPIISTGKVDLLFMIDNSSSMADKQAILADVVPNLVDGLTRPPCVDASGAPAGGKADPLSTRDNHFGCATGDAQFAPITDIHIGIISSSLGSFGGDVCPDTGRFNDHAHLLTASKGGGTVQEASPSGFLAWFPSVQANEDAKTHPKPANPIGDVAKLDTAFQQLLVGVDQTGCGLEAQLESVYHFLIAPDPWVKIVLDPNQVADFQDVDVDVLKQRADFLRPDSFVAVVMLTDEDDSSPDPLSVGGQGWAFDANQFPGSTVFRGDGKTTTAPRGTSICAQNPASPDCTSCGFAQTCNPNDVSCQNLKSDPNCQKNGGYFGPNEDQLNVRYHRMKERYGIDPQYPISRYVDGFTKDKIADRANEHRITNVSGRRTVGAYEPVAKCRNPLFAATLPTGPGDEICNMPRGARTQDFIAFVLIGGVPNKLLSPTPNWNAILGRDPINFDYDGIDPHMIQSVTPRPGLPPPSAADTADPITGREYDTAGDDLQYACIFALPTPRQCQAGDSSCDCGGTKSPPLCNGSSQIKAKAYPTVRELEVVRALGDAGVVASICPESLADKTAPTYGYNPAVVGLVRRMGPFLSK